MHPSQAMFSGKAPKKGANPSLSFWSLFRSAARTEQTLQYMPQGDRYSFFTTIFSPPLFVNSKEIELLSVVVCLNHFGY